MKSFIVALIILCALPLQALFVWLYVRSLPAEKKERLKELFKKKNNKPSNDGE